MVTRFDEAHEDNGTYWYFNTKSFGFSITPRINQCQADTLDDDGQYRLSWLIDGGGGWRAGNVKELNDSEDWMKLVYYLTADGLLGAQVASAVHPAHSVLATLCTIIKNSATRLPRMVDVTVPLTHLISELDAIGLHEPLLELVTSTWAELAITSVDRELVQRLASDTVEKGGEAGTLAGGGMHLLRTLHSRILCYFLPATAAWPRPANVTAESVDAYVGALCGIFCESADLSAFGSLLPSLLLALRSAPCELRSPTVRDAPDLIIKGLMQASLLPQDVNQWLPELRAIETRCLPSAETRTTEPAKKACSKCEAKPVIERNAPGSKTIRVAAHSSPQAIFWPGAAALRISVVMADPAPGKTNGEATAELAPSAGVGADQEGATERNMGDTPGESSLTDGDYVASSPVPQVQVSAPLLNTLQPLSEDTMGITSSLLIETLLEPSLLVDSISVHLAGLETTSCCSFH